MASEATSQARAQSGHSSNSFGSRANSSAPEGRRNSLTRRILGQYEANPGSPSRRFSPARSGTPGQRLDETYFTAQMHRFSDSKDAPLAPAPKGALPRPIGGTEKLNTFSGVFVPTSLNVLSILMFLRFGFILGQAGVLGMVTMLIAAYTIDLVTVLSLSAIATNGTVRGGGAYYLISRSLGPEFGGSIGVVFYLGQAFNAGMNAVGLVDTISQNFGADYGTWSRWLPESYWFLYLWGTVTLVMCSLVCLGGSGLFARASNGLLLLLLISIISIPISGLVQSPYSDAEHSVKFTGMSAETFKSNFFPRFTRHAAGSQLLGKENFRDLFGILYPATSGVFAGASMSGDLRNPSRAIPAGTLSSMVMTFVAYLMVILVLAATVTRPSLYGNVNVIQETNISAVLIILGEVCSSIFSVIMGVIGAAKLLQALARDELLPKFGVFSQGSQIGDTPSVAILATFLICQVTMLGNINQIAILVTMSYLMTFLVMNLACFLLKIGSAPNFRPSFRFFGWQTALFGTIASGASMFFVDGLAASGSVALLLCIFLLIHYTTPPKSWGDVSQNLIYHQVRKYLLRLKQEHVKFWRPQILLFVNDPRRSYKLIQFCNGLKKGGLFVLGHVIISQDFDVNVPEARRQQQLWNKYIDFSHIKAFVQVIISPAIEWGTRNMVLSAGLGGMRPNIIVMGFYNVEAFRKRQPLVDLDQTNGNGDGDGPDDQLPANQVLPTDACRAEGDVTPAAYVTVLEDLMLSLQINVAIAMGFSKLKLPGQTAGPPKKYIDLWPIQMSAEIATDDQADSTQNLLNTNFDTYTLILQLGCILNTVPNWKRAYGLRVTVFVEYESDVEEERGRVQSLLDNLRIRAEVIVFWLASGQSKLYQMIVNGDYGADQSKLEKEVNKGLRDEDWWQDIQQLRGRRESQPSETLAQDFQYAGRRRSSSEAQNGFSENNAEHARGVRKVLRKINQKRPIFRLKDRRSSFALSTSGPRMSMTTNRMPESFIDYYAAQESSSEEESSSSDESDPDADAIDEHAIQDEVDGTIPERLGSDSLFAQSSSWHFDSHDTHDPHNDDEGRDLSMSPGAAEYTPTPGSNAALIGENCSPFSDPRPPALQSETAFPHVLIISPTEVSQSKTTDMNASARPKRPLNKRVHTTPKFSSRPVPETRVTAEEGPGPSIMFTEPAGRENSRPQYSIYDRNSAPSGFPGQQSVPLSFNDLPCRAQHLILNELMQQQSKDTAAIFTTLPSPVAGTGRSEEESMVYLTDLEVLCKGLPPTLLVYSNSMTVTMNL